MSAHTPSKYQQAIIDWFANGQGNALIQARAGSGKTSTLVMLANMIPTTKTSVFLAFNKSIATELQQRLPSHVDARTFHSLCFREVMRGLAPHNKGQRIKVDARKLDNIADNLWPRNHLAVRPAVLRTTSLLKNAAVLPADATNELICSLMAHFDVTWDSPDYNDQDVCEFVRTLLSANNADTLTIDFDDQLYFVVVYNLKMTKYDYVMTDESQDLNEIQRIILRRIMGPRTRLIAVGDDKQAIYGFRGASSDSMEQIARNFDTIELPLSISYRCPQRVIEAAQQFVPDIEARPNAPEGTILHAPTYNLADLLPTDLLVCRNTAPLVTTAYKLIRRRIPARIMGRDIGKGLTNLVKQLTGKRGTLADLPTKLAEYQERETTKALEKRQEARAQSIADKCESLIALIDSMDVDDVNRGVPGLIAIIESMFDDRQQRGMTTLATVHKAKGLEAPRVFIIDAHLMPSKYARQPWQQQQERNLQYVAITRALDTLVYVESKNWK